MKHLLTALALAGAAFVVSAQTPPTPPAPVTPPAQPAMPAPAAPPGVAPIKAKTPQQQKMAQCNDQATGKTGDDRKAFMKTCLSAKQASQTDKMKTCNASAKGMKGDERKAFMKDCLSK